MNFELNWIHIVWIGAFCLVGLTRCSQLGHVPSLIFSHASNEEYRMPMPCRIISFNVRTFRSRNMSWNKILLFRITLKTVKSICAWFIMFIGLLLPIIWILCDVILNRYWSRNNTQSRNDKDLNETWPSNCHGKGYVLSIRGIVYFSLSGKINYHCLKLCHSDAASARLPVIVIVKNKEQISSADK